MVPSSLLSNAIKFAPPGSGRLEVALSGGASQVRVTVTDTGRGMRADFRPYVFDRFRQADTGPARTHGGPGLGLAIVHHIADRLPDGSGPSVR